MVEPELLEAQPAPGDQSDKTTGYVMLGIFGLFTLLFCCGGSALTLIAGADSERAGMQAAFLSSGPACCSISGFLMAAIGLVAFKGKPALKIAAPFLVGILAGIVGAVCTLIFFETIWRSL